MEKIDLHLVKNLLETLSFLCAPVLVYIAYRALEQINEAKKQVTETRESRIISSKRESYKIAAEKCEHYLNNIIPLIDKMDSSIIEKEITFFEDSKVKIKKDGINVKPEFKNDEEVDKVFDLPTVEVFNALESFSTFFTSGVADEKIGYLTVGVTFCETVKGYLPLVVMFNQSKHYNNILSLFIAWNNRQEKERLLEEKKKIDNQLNDTFDFSIDTIGTK